MKIGSHVGMSGKEMFLGSVKDFHYRLVIMYKTPVIILTLFSLKVNLHSKKTYFSQYACLFCRFSRFF